MASSIYAVNILIAMHNVTPENAVKYAGRSRFSIYFYSNDCFSMHLCNCKRNRSSFLTSYTFIPFHSEVRDFSVGGCRFVDRKVRFQVSLGSRILPPPCGPGFLGIPNNLYKMGIGDSFSRG